MTTMTMTEIREDWADALREVGRGDRLDVCRRDDIVAIVAPPVSARNTAAAALIAKADELGRRIDEHRRARQPLPTTPVISAARADDIITWIREGRDAR